MSKTFLIYCNKKHINKDSILQDCIFVQEKIHFMAFLFTFIWLIYNKLWKSVIFYISASIIISCLSFLEIIDSNIKNFIFLCISTYFAIYSSSIIQKNLVSKNYLLKSIIYAESKESALSKLLLNLKLKNNNKKSNNS